VSEADSESPGRPTERLPEPGGGPLQMPTHPPLAAPTVRGTRLMLRPAAQSGRRKILVIYNPTAGRRRRKRFRKTLRQLARLGCVVTVRETLAQGEARTFAAEGAGQGYDAIVVAGGDGTVNEAAAALAFTNERVAVIPIGTANVLATELGLPMRPEAIAHTIVNGPERAIHFGRLGERHFVMMAGVGFDARVVAAMGTGLKLVLGKYAYVLGALRELMRHKPARFTIRLDHETVEVAGAIIANGRRYAGRYVVAPKANLEEPVLHAVLFLRRGRIATFFYALSMLLGTLPRSRGVRIVEARAGAFEGPEGEPVQADGDPAGTTPVDFRVAGRRLTVIVPRP
jgi:YegS/Rv2252/BmrU family lipid kinase